MDNNKTKSIAVHRLVAYEFCDNYNVNDKNSLKSFNYYENLEWVTYSENNKHRFEHGNGSSAKPPILRGENNPHNVYSTEFIKEICFLLTKRYTVKEILDYFECIENRKKIISLIHDIRCRRTWGHISRNYDFETHLTK